MNNIFKYIYQQNVFCNHWGVKRFEQKHQVFVPFVADYKLYEHALADKNIDLEYNYDLDYLQILRRTQSYIKLYYSGGSDSHNILVTAIENKIFLDEIVVITRNLYNKEMLQPCDVEISQQAIPFLNTLNSSQIGKVTFRNYDAEYMRALYRSPDWMFNVPGGDISFRIGQWEYFFDDVDNSDCCQIVGSEKPSLVLYKNRWFATTIDTQLTPSLFMHNACLFYMMPENIKSYLVQAINFKNKILSSGQDLNKSLQLFSSLMYYNRDLHLGKHRGTQLLNGKDQLALQEVIKEEDFDLLLSWYKSLEYLASVFPDIKNGNSYYRTPTGKFLWFIDLETFEIFSQTDLIPNGFEH